MGYTKKQFIEDALTEIGIASYIFDVETEQLNNALHKLDSMMATWNFKGIRVGYPLPTNPDDSNINEQTFVPDSANEAIILNLAIRLAPSYGKVVQMETKSMAKEAYNVLLSLATMPREMNLGITTRGAGQKNIRYPYIMEYDDSIQAGNDSDIILQ